MLKVFVSSTFRDLEKERKQLIERLDDALEAAAMEKFIPYGNTPQEAAINELRESDIAVFLISSYGSLLDKCVVKECSAECSMKSRRKTKISYTHCEYLYTLSEGKLHKVYRVEQPILEDKNKKTQKKFENFLEKAGNEFYRKIVRKSEDIQIITEHLSSNILKWYLKEKIKLRDFCGRKKILKELLEKMEKGSVEVYGVGGIGKTTLVHVALLLQILKGKKVISLTREPYYTTESGEKRRETTGSGYIHFKKKVKEQEVGERITLDDVMDALKVPEEVRIQKDDKKIDYILQKIKNEGIILFIDDFHLADEKVAELVKSTQNVVVSSRKKMGYALYDVHVKGIDEIDEFIDLVSSGTITGGAKQKIREVAEGHPVSTIILIRNYQKIDFAALEDFKQGLDILERHAEEFLRRVIEEVLSDEALEMLRVFAVLNPRLTTNIDVDVFEKVYETSEFRRIFNELVDTCMIEKKEERVYQFCFHHIRDSLTDDDKSRHQTALQYYDEKVERYKNIEDMVERLYHEVKMEWVLLLIDEFLELRKKVKPVQREPSLRLIEVGEELRNYFEGEDRGIVSGTLGLLYSDLKRFEEAHEAYREALDIRKKLADKNPDVYLPDLATTQNNLGILYWNLKKFEEAQEAYREALKIYKKLADKNPDVYSLDLLQTQANIGALYISTDRTEVGIKILETFLKTKNLPPDIRASYSADLAEGYETLKDEKAALYYFLASANYFILYNRGVHCLDDVIHNLEKVVNVGDETIKGDALLTKVAIDKLLNPQKKIKIPEVNHSKRGKSIIEAFRGKRFEFEPENEIDSMALTLAKEIRVLLE